MNTSTYFVHTISLLYVMKLLIIFGIKIYQKLLSFLTIQKSELVNMLSVSSFAATIKPHLLMVPITNVGKSGLYYS